MQLPSDGQNGETFDDEKVKIKPFKPRSGDLLLPASFGISQLDPPEPLSIDSGAQTEKFYATAKNPNVKAALTLREIGAFWPGWGIQADNDYDKHPEWEALDELILDLLWRQVKGMSEYETFENSLKAILYNSYRAGFSVAELDYRFIDSEWWVTAIKTEASFLFDFDVFPNGALANIDYRGDIQRQIHGGDLKWKMVVATYPYLNNKNYYGESEILSLFHTVELLELMERAEAEGSQRLSIRPILHWYGAGQRTPEQLQMTRQALLNMDSASVVSLPSMQVPDGSGGIIKDDVEVLDDRASSEGVGQTQDIIERNMKTINRCLGVPDDLGFTNTGAGSFAKAKEEMNIFIARVIRDEKYLESIVNRQIFPRMAELNYSDLPAGYNLPRFKFDIIEEDAMEKLLNMYSTAVQSGILSPDEPFIRETLDFPPASSDVLEEQAEESEEEKSANDASLEG